jgi:hypothetical protein
MATDDKGVLVVAVIAAVVAFATTPNEDEFKTHVTDWALKVAQQGAAGVVGAGLLAASRTTFHNFLVFSTYTIRPPGLSTYTCYGAFRYIQCVQEK